MGTHFQLNSSMNNRMLSHIWDMFNKIGARVSKRRGKSLVYVGTNIRAGYDLGSAVHKPKDRHQR